MKRRQFLKTAGMAAIVAPLVGRSGIAATEKKPNIIYVLADDLGYGDLGCYGQKDILTPNIDRIAAEGMKFTDHYAGSALCAPSRCVLMTGLHTGHCFVRGNRALPFEGNVPLPADSVTIGKVLQKVGYTTGAMGKWGLGYPGSEGDPNNQGFDHFFGYNCQRAAHKYYPDHLWRNDKKVMLEGNVGKQVKTDYSHDLMTKEALWFINKNKTVPFFLYLPYTIPHTEFSVPELGVYEAKPWTREQKTQAAMITRMDRDIGTILALIKKLGLDDNTLVMFVSDNGPHGAGGTLQKFNAAGPLRAKKGSLYDGGIRVPLVVRWPGKIKPGSLSALPSCFQDMMPTFADLAGAKVPSNIDGLSMAPTLLGQKGQVLHKYLYWELGANRALRMGKWKAVQPGGMKKPDAPIELFDLSVDIAESKNLAVAHPAIVKEITKIFVDAHTYTPWSDWKVSPEEVAKQKAKKG